MAKRHVQSSCETTIASNPASSNETSTTHQADSNQAPDTTSQARYHKTCPAGWTIYRKIRQAVNWFDKT